MIDDYDTIKSKPRIKLVYYCRFFLHISNLLIVGKSFVNYLSSELKHLCFLLKHQSN